ncbi:MAG TPA: sulfatase-like hydrolase/transferase [Bryobacteraceae bacterium]|nr:sulfatase-like hydrolase/transferase [Bryobacteraceae bacterium]
MQLTRRELILGAAALPALAAPKPAARPGIVLIVVEDLGAWMLGCYGNSDIRTPAMDLLARSGTRFINSYAAAGTAAPGRASLLAGLAPRQLPVSLESVPSLADVLSGAGYQSAFTGAWASESKPHGFSSVELSGDFAEVTAKASAFIDARKPGQPSLQVVSYTLSGAVPAKYLDAYASVPFNNLGWEPASARATNREALRDTVASIRKAAAAVTAIDDQVAALVRKLDERGLRDETLIVLTGSNGSLLGRHGLWGDSRGGNPPAMFEEVVSVPLVWQWHGRTAPEALRPEFVSALDLAPALAELTGAPLPQGRKLPGRSYLPAVLNRPFPKKAPWRSQVFAESGGSIMMRDKRYKLVQHASGPGELYDVLNDRRERVNQYVNPQFVTIRDELYAEIDTWKKSLA